MKSLTIAALIAAQLSIAAQPAAAAELYDDRSAGAQERGTFVGARLRVPLGGAKEAPRAGLALTAVQRSEGRGSARFAKGVELGFAGDDKIRLSVGGQRFSDVQARLAGGQPGPEGRKAGVSTVGWIAIGVAALAVVYVAAFVTCQETNCLGSE